MYYDVNTSYDGDSVIKKKSEIPEIPTSIGHHITQGGLSHLSNLPT